MTHTVFLPETEFPDLTGKTPLQRNIWWAGWMTHRVIDDTLGFEVDGGEFVVMVEGDDELNVFNAGLVEKFGATVVHIRKEQTA